jgi:hypothetical protein
LTGWALTTPQGYWDANYRNMIHSPEYQQGFRQGMGQGALLGAAVIGSMIPGVGEQMDMDVINDPNAPAWQKRLSGVSLAANVVTRGLAPNAGSLLKAAKCAELRPYGGPGGGHHVPAKSAFEGAAGYDLNSALAIPTAELRRLGVNHGLVSGAQQTLYREFARSGEQLTWQAMQAIEIKALIRGGMPPAMAEATVIKAIDALKSSGVPGPTRIPWGGN